MNDASRQSVQVERVPFPVSQPGLLTGALASATTIPTEGIWQRLIRQSAWTSQALPEAWQKSARSYNSERRPSNLATIPPPKPLAGASISQQHQSGFEGICSGERVVDRKA